MFSPALGSWRRDRRLRRGRRAGAAVAAVESLERRSLLTTFNGFHDVEVLGRDSTGQWWASGYDDAGTMQHERFAKWKSTVAWVDVRTGDFDGDQAGDVIGRDASTGTWWVSLSDQIGSTTRVAGWWSPFTTWSDVSVVNLAGPGDRLSGATFGRHFTNKDDLVGRAADGTWYAAVSNGDGTFDTVALDHWSPTAGWRDVVFVDVNYDSILDIVGRTSGGTWYGSVSTGALAYETVYLAQWSEAANWQDVFVFTGGGMNMLLGRAGSGAWYALGFFEAGLPLTAYAGVWNEAAGWRDVQVADLNEDLAPDILGRTSTGQWWMGTLAGAGGTLDWYYLGSWNESAGWTDVRVVDGPDAVVGVGIVHDRDAVVGRTSVGDWWISELPEGGGYMTHTPMGHWNAVGGWNDVDFGRFTRPPVFVNYQYEGAVQHIDVYIRGHRGGTNVRIENHDTVFADGIRVTYFAPTTGDIDLLPIYPVGPGAPDWNIYFDGQIATDLFVNDSDKPSRAYGWAGDDTLDGLGNGADDFLRGGDGDDDLFGDPVADPPPNDTVINS